MPKWRFWSSEGKTAPAQPATADLPAVASHARGFTPPPPRSHTGLAADLASEDPVFARKVTRHEALERQLEQSELAASVENPWTERVRLVDEAIAGVDLEIRQPVERVDREPVALPSIPFTINNVRADAPSRVSLQVGEHQLTYEEEVDWAERGTTVVRGDMRLVTDDLNTLTTELNLDAHASERLEASLFALATAIRDATLEGSDRPQIADFNELLVPCPVCGDIRLWNGVCLNCERRRAELIGLEGERHRLFEERDAILADRAEKVDQLSVLRKRFADSAAGLEESGSGDD